MADLDRTRLTENPVAALRGRCCCNSNFFFCFTRLFGRQTGFHRLSAPRAAAASGFTGAPKVASAPRGRLAALGLRATLFNPCRRPLKTFPISMQLRCPPTYVQDAYYPPFCYFALKITPYSQTHARSIENLNYPCTPKKSTGNFVIF